jgi:hypothetical protein
MILLLDYSQLGLGHDGCELIVGHIDGSLASACQSGGCNLGHRNLRLLSPSHPRHHT